MEQGETIHSNKFLVDQACVLLSKLNPRIRRIWLAKPRHGHRSIASTEFLVLRHRSGFSLAYLFCLCSSDKFQDVFAGRALGTSTSHQRVKPDDLMQLPSVVPSEALVRSFDTHVEPILDLIHTLRVKNQKLRLTRDLLLPRLLSGHVDVSNLKDE